MTRDAAHAADDAIARGDAHADATWKDHALRAIYTRPVGARFTTEDLKALIPPHVHTHDARAWGGVMRAAARRGWIVATPDYRASGEVACHGRPMRVWVRLWVQTTEPTQC